MPRWRPVYSAALEALRSVEALLSAPLVALRSAVALLYATLAASIGATRPVATRAARQSHKAAGERRKRSLARGDGLG